jgi:hypothetical protein
LKNCLNQDLQDLKIFKIINKSLFCGERWPDNKPGRASIPKDLGMRVGRFLLSSPDTLGLHTFSSMEKV